MSSTDESVGTYMLGVTDGERHAAALAMRPLMEAEQTRRIAVRARSDAYAHEREVVAALQSVKRENRRLRLQLRRRRALTLALVLVAIALTFLATYNVMLNGWSL